MTLTARNLAIVSLLLAGTSPGWTAEVRDRAGLFTPSARREAESQLGELERTTGTRVVIETAKPGIKEAIGRLLRRPQLKDLDPDAQRRALSEEARRRAVAVGEQAVYVFIYHDPPLAFAQVEVGADPDLQQALPAARRREVAEQVVARLTKDNPDAALADLVASLSARLRTLSASHSPPPVFHWASVGWSIAVLLALWLVVELAQVASGGQPGGGSAVVSLTAFAGGSFLTGLFAAMARCGSLGAAARNECPPLPAAQPDQTEVEEPDLRERDPVSSGHAHDQH
jgi:hypothetical protein